MGQIPAGRNRLLRIMSVAAAVAVIPLLNPSGASADDARPTSAAEQDSLLRVLSSPSGDADTLRIPGGAGERVVASSARYLGSAKGAEHWAARDRSGDYCVISQLPAEEDWTAAAGCASPEKFAEQGVSLQVVGPTGDVESHLLPDGYAPKSSSEFEVVSDNLAVSDAYASGRDPVRVASRTPDGPALALTDMAPLEHRVSADVGRNSSNLGAGPIQTQDSHIYKNTASLIDELYRSATAYNATGGSARVGGGTAEYNAYISTWAGDALVNESRSAGYVELYHDVVNNAHSGCKWYDWRPSPGSEQWMECYVYY